MKFIEILKRIRGFSFQNTIQSLFHYVFFTLKPFHQFLFIFINSINEFTYLVCQFINSPDRNIVIKSLLIFLQILMIILSFQVSFMKLYNYKSLLIRSAIIMMNLVYSIEIISLREINTQFPIFLILFTMTFQKIDKIIFKQILFLVILLFIIIRSAFQWIILEFCFSMILSVVFAFISSTYSSYSIVLDQSNNINNNTCDLKNEKINDESKSLDNTHFLFNNNSLNPFNKQFEHSLKLHDIDPLKCNIMQKYLDGTSIMCKVSSSKVEVNQGKQSIDLSRIIIDQLKTGIALIDEKYELVYFNKQMKQKLLLNKGDEMIEKLLKIQFIKKPMARKSLLKSASYSQLINQGQQLSSKQVSSTINQKIASIQQFIKKLESSNNSNQITNFKSTNIISTTIGLNTLTMKKGQPNKQSLQQSEFYPSSNYNSSSQEVGQYKHFKPNFNKMKQCIIPHQVLEVFKQQQNLSLKDVIQYLFQNQDKMKEQRFRSVSDINKQNSFDILQQKEQFDCNRYNEIIYFIESNNLIVHYKENKNDVNFVGMRIGFYTNTTPHSSQNFVMVEYFDTSKLLTSMNQKEIIDYKNRMLASVSHELRTPLNCSIQMLQLLMKRFENEDIENKDLIETKEMLIKPALNSNFLLLNIINDILDYGQISAGNFELTFTPLSLIELVTECVDMIYYQTSLKGIVIEATFDSNLPEMINSDASRIRQVLLNLLTNSLKFTEKGFIRINITLEEREIIRVDVSDTGCGIPQESLQKIVGTFGNKENSKFLNTLGAGLGMSITNNLAMGLGGNRRMIVKSKLNEGSTFSFFIINREQNKLGCKYKLKDIFNQQVVKWETFTQLDTKTNSNNQSSKQLMFNMMKTFKMSQDLFKSSKLDTLQNQNIEHNETLQIQKKISEQSEHIQLVNNAQQNMITLTLKPSQKLIESYLKSFSITSNSQHYSQQENSAAGISVKSRLPKPKNNTQDNFWILYDQNTKGNESQTNHNEHPSIGVTASLKEDKTSFFYQISSFLAENPSQQNLESCQILDDHFSENFYTHQTNIIKRRNKYFIDQRFDLSSPKRRQQQSRQSDILDEQSPPQETTGRNTSSRIKSSQQLVSKKKSEFINQNEIKKPNDTHQKSNQITLQLRKLNIEKSCPCSKILIVDDNDFNLYSLQLLLQTYGFTVDKSTSGIDAIHKVEQKYSNQHCCNKYQLIFMDIDMPIKDGHQTTIEILDYHKNKFSPPPVISACSAYVQEAEQQKALRNGMKYYITKPINIKQLEQVLASVFLQISTK